jgi:hypothetical protein
MYVWMKSDPYPYHVWIKGDPIELDEQVMNIKNVNYVP